MVCGGVAHDELALWTVECEEESFQEVSSDNFLIDVWRGVYVHRVLL